MAGMYAPKLADLRAMTDEQLEAKHDELLMTDRGKAEAYEVGIGYLLEELARRREHKQTQTMVRLTWAIAVLTVFIAVLTALLYWHELKPMAL